MGVPGGGLALGGGAGILGLILALLFNLGGGGGGGFNIPGMEQFPASPQAQARQRDPNVPDPDAETVAFVEFVVDHVQDTWTELFRQANRAYQPTTLVIFEQAVQTGCGTAGSETGPFYCPADSKVYIDLGFFRELATRFEAPGDFAQAYVIAHEFGHHVQNVLGISDDVRRSQQRNPDDANELSIRLELQADCLAGVWGNAARDLLEPGDIEEGLNAAASVGDDRIQREATGRVNPESWTHGSSAQRQEWFRNGFDSGDLNDCDTFD